MRNLESNYYQQGFIPQETSWECEDPDSVLLEELAGQAITNPYFYKGWQGKVKSLALLIILAGAGCAGPSAPAEVPVQATETPTGVPVPTVPPTPEPTVPAAPVEVEEVEIPIRSEVGITVGAGGEVVVGGLGEGTPEPQLKALSISGDVAGEALRLLEEKGELPEGTEEVVFYTDASGNTLTFLSQAEGVPNSVGAYPSTVFYDGVEHHWNPSTGYYEDEEGRRVRIDLRFEYPEGYSPEIVGFDSVLVRIKNQDGSEKFKVCLVNDWARQNEEGTRWFHLLQESHNPELVEEAVEGLELRNCTTNNPEILEAGIKWAIDTALEIKGNPFELLVNKGEEGMFIEDTMLISEDTEVVIEVVSFEKSAAYLKFNQTNRFGYYNEDGRLLIVVRGNAPAALYRGLLGLLLSDEYHRLGLHDSAGIGRQISFDAWDTIDRQPLKDLWKSVIDNILLSDDSVPVGG